MVLRACRLFDLQDCETTSSSYGHLTNHVMDQKLGMGGKVRHPYASF